ncbi:hypothetical protein [Amycolatopsis samaneae]|uniref:Uncharacterized protein n=1 Tax=Amycolatopsis samaneae TaxID=664691 RepID=A0ABW5GNC9_9PSEU
MQGRHAQVWGALHHSPAPIPGLPGATIQLHYGGHFDFLTIGNRRGELDLYATLRHPLLGRECSIGTPGKPVRSVVYNDDTVDPVVISPKPETYFFGIIDQQLALPATQHCGPFGALVDHRLGLPSPSGHNVFKQESFVQYKWY